VVLITKVQIRQLQTTSERSRTSDGSDTSAELELRPLPLCTKTCVRQRLHTLPHDVLHRRGEFWSILGHLGALETDPGHSSTTRGVSGAVLYNALRPALTPPRSSSSGLFRSAPKPVSGKDCIPHLGALETDPGHSSTTRGVSGAVWMASGHSGRPGYGKECIFPSYLPECPKIPGAVLDCPKKL
jgi:hypothetical protein